MKSKKKISSLVLTGTLLLGVPALLTSCNNKVEQIITYKVSVAKNDEATITVSKSEAKAGDTITVTIGSIASGKVVESVKAGELEVTTVTENKTYTFVMGESDVEVVVTLKDAALSYDININKDENVTIKTLVNDAEVSKASEGDVVKVSLTFAEEYELDNISISGASLTTVTEGSEYSFTMGKEAVSITVSSKVKVYEISKVLDEHVVSATIKNGENEVSEAKKGDSLTISLVFESGYELNEISAEGVTFEAIVGGSNEFSFVMPSSNVSISVSSKAISYNLSETHDEHISSVKFIVNEEEVNSAVIGSEVYVVVALEDDYAVDKIISSEVILEEVSGKENTYKFIMSNATISVNVTSKLKTYELSATIDKNISSVKYFIGENEVSEASVGDNVKFLVETKEGYVVDVVKNGETVLEADESNYYSFVFAKDTNIVITSKVVAKVTIASLNTYTDKCSTSGSTAPYIVGYSIGDEVEEGTTLTVHIDSYNLDSYKFLLYVNNNEPIEFVEIVGGGEASASFVVGSENLNLVISHLTLDNDNYEWNVTINYNENDELYKVYGEESGRTFLGSKYSSRYIWIVPNDGVMISSVTYVTDDSDTSHQANATGYAYSAYDYSGTETNITFTITATKVEPKNITITNPENVDIVGSLTGVTPGKVVELIINPHEGVEVNGVSEVSCDNEEITVSKSDFEYDKTTHVLSFTMPNGNVTLTLSTKEVVALKGETSESITGWEFYTNASVSPSKIESSDKGSTIQGKPIVADGYYVDKVYVGDEELSSSSSYGYKYSIPSDYSSSVVTFSATTKKYLTVTYEETETYTISGVYSSGYKEGQQVNATIEAKAGYNIKSVKIEGSETELTPSGDYNSVYSFTISGDSKLVVETEACVTTTISFEQSASLKSLNVKDRYNKSLTSGDTVNVGSIVYIEASANSGYTINSIKLGDNVATLVEGSSYRYSVVVPSENATLSFDVSEEAHHNINFVFDSEATYIYNLKDNGSYVTTSTAIVDNVMKGYDGHTYTMKFSLNKYTDYSWISGESVKITKNTDGSEVERAESDYINSYGDIEFSFEMPTDSDITITITPKVKEKYTATLDEESAKIANLTSSGFYSYTTYENGTSFNEGTKVYVRLNGTDAIDLANYKYVLQVLDADGNNVGLGYYGASSYQFSSTSNTDYEYFTLPASNVTITITKTAK